MFYIPNTSAENQIPSKKNDLFRRFRNYFIGATEKEFHKYGSYSRDGYISVNGALEDQIMDVLSHNINEVLPIAGSTGIGKTYLLLYCLKTYYDVDDIPTNTPVYFDIYGRRDLVYYSDFNITEQSVLEDPSTLMLAKIRAMSSYIMNHFKVTEPAVDNYIYNNKLEVEFYAENNTVFQKELYKLIGLILDADIKNVVFIFDDLESLTEQQQFSLIGNFLVLYENFKGKSEKRFNSKFIFCLRNSTYFNIYKQDFFNTHRISKAAYLTVAPSLSEVFEKRFDIIIKSEKVKKADNIESWQQAKEILDKISRRVDSSYTNLLIKLNNNNVCNALDDFLNILSNRRWTQRNVNPAESFVIDEYDYRINDINILRVLSMGEQDVYYKTQRTSIRCILPNPGVSTHEDILCLLVLRAFRQVSNSVTEEISSIIKADDLLRVITKCIVPNCELNNHIRDEVKDIVFTALTYYKENRFIRENVDPEHMSAERTYFMLPRGEKIFDLFFSQTILFSIYRDAFLWDDRQFDIRCSNELSFRELLIEAIKYGRQLVEAEKKLFECITENEMWRNYISVFGRWSVAESFSRGIRKSCMQYYNYEHDNIPDSIKKQVDDLETEISELLNSFDAYGIENSIF